MRGLDGVVRAAGMAVLLAGAVVGRAAPAVAGEIPDDAFTVTIESDAESHVFAGEAPALRVRVRSTLAEAVDATVTAVFTSVTKPEAAPIALPENALQLAARGQGVTALEARTPDFGVYEVAVEVAAGDRVGRGSARFAVLPKPVELTDAQRDASLYGMNVHGGGGMQGWVSPFAKAGVVWFRDYAFTYEWMAQAKGADGRYDGWPHPRRNMAIYDANRARVLACLQGAIRFLEPDQIRAGHKPTDAFLSVISDAVKAFPQIIAWELDNEYELHAGRGQAERDSGWQTYRNYHEAFARVVHANNPRAWAVENGRSHLAPETMREIVASGQFDGIDVVNSHYYSGIESPETSFVNSNFHADADELRQAAVSFYDHLREAKAAATSDGKPRQHWLTEFGWDTLAGNIVTWRQQAAFLPRAYMMFPATGTEKGFWFWHTDAAEGKGFFDGCGLTTHNREPKPALAAFAGMTQILPTPTYVGPVFAGPGTWGYAFLQDEKYVVALWTVQDVEDGPEIDLPGVAAFDAFANPLPAGARRLGLFPTYFVDVPADTPYVRSARARIESRVLVVACAGDTFDVEISGRAIEGAARPAALAVSADLPEGWSITGQTPLAVGDDDVARTTVTIRVGPNAPLEDLDLMLTAKDGDEVVASMPIRVLAQPAFAISVKAAAAKTEGARAYEVGLLNRAKRAIAGTLRVEAPDGASTATPFDAVAAGARRVFPVEYASAAEGNPTLVVETDDGGRLRKPLPPTRLVLPRVAGDFPLTGDPKAWPAAARLPEGTLDSTLAEPQADMWLAWAPEGLYIGVDARDSIVRVNSPQTFWSGDALELFLDLTDDRRDNEYVEGRHQFWLVPLPEQERVYVGRWKRADEINATVEDMKGVEGNALRNPNGYTFTALIPANLLDGWAPKAGDEYGLSLNLTIKGRQFDREAYWPLSKTDDIQSKPMQWGKVTLK